MSSGVVIGIDLGEKRVGVALSDPDRLVATSHDLFDGSDVKKLIRRIAKLAEEQEATQVVLGLPRNMDGSLGERAEVSLRFAARLEKETGLPVDTWDERLSSAEAERTLRYGRGRETRKGEKASRLGRRRESKGEIDRIAAVIILQGWLDRQGSGR